MDLAQELHKQADCSMFGGYYWKQIQLIARDGGYSVIFPIDPWTDIDAVKRAKAWLEANGFVVTSADKEFMVEW